jgi:hypothetical protein
MSRVTSWVLLAGSALVLGACAVAPPTGPSVAVLPGAGKSLQQFNNDDLACRQYAGQMTNYASPGQAANNAAVGSAVVGTGVGAAAGALIGAAAGNPGAGAAIGAGAGLLTGTAAGANNAQYSSDQLQQRYDISYVQCMAAKGNKVPDPSELSSAAAPGYAYGPGYAYPAYGYPGYYAYPPVVVGVGGCFHCWRHW